MATEAEDRKKTKEPSVFSSAWNWVTQKADAADQTGQAMVTAPVNTALAARKGVQGTLTEIAGNLAGALPDLANFTAKNPSIMARAGMGEGALFVAPEVFEQMDREATPLYEGSARTAITEKLDAAMDAADGALNLQPDMQTKGAQAAKEMGGLATETALIFGTGGMSLIRTAGNVILRGGAGLVKEGSRLMASASENIASTKIAHAFGLGAKPGQITFDAAKAAEPAAPAASAAKGSVPEFAPAAKGPSVAEQVWGAPRPAAAAKGADAATTARIEERLAGLEGRAAKAEADLAKNAQINARQDDKNTIMHHGFVTRQLYQGLRGLGRQFPAASVLFNGMAGTVRGVSNAGTVAKTAVVVGVPAATIAHMKTDGKKLEWLANKTTEAGSALAGAVGLVSTDMADAAREYGPTVVTAAADFGQAGVGMGATYLSTLAKNTGVNLTDGTATAIVQAAKGHTVDSARTLAQNTEIPSNQTPTVTKAVDTAKRVTGIDTSDDDNEDDDFDVPGALSAFFNDKSRPALPLPTDPAQLKRRLAADKMWDQMKEMAGNHPLAAAGAGIGMLAGKGPNRLALGAAWAALGFVLEEVLGPQQTRNLAAKFGAAAHDLKGHMTNELGDFDLEHAGQWMLGKAKDNPMMAGGAALGLILGLASRNKAEMLLLPILLGAAGAVFSNMRNGTDGPWLQNAIGSMTSSYGGLGGFNARSRGLGPVYDEGPLPPAPRPRPEIMAPAL